MAVLRHLDFFALDASTGDQIWSYDPFGGEYGMFGMGVNRGLMYWEDDAEKRIYFTAGSHLYALNAKTGYPILSFGENGKVDLKKGTRPGRSMTGSWCPIPPASSMKTT